MKTKCPLLSIAWVLLVSLVPARAQWLTQEIVLQPSWNAVYLSVQPTPADCTTVFSDLLVRGVWRWNLPVRSVQFSPDRQRIAARPHDWLCWLPSSHPQAFLTSLRQVQAGHSYLIQLDPGAPPVTWKVKGTPLLFRREWKADTWNFTGLPVAPQTTTFADFFRSTTAIGTTRIDGGEIHEVDAAGHGVQLWETARRKIQPGTAYWILSREATDYAGPLRITLDYGQILEFPSSVSVRRLYLRNESAGSKPITVRALPSETPPGPDLPAVAGPALLAWCEQDWSSGTPQTVYRPLETAMTRSLAAGATWVLELTPRRADMGERPQGSRWQSLIEVSDGTTVRQMVGVWAE